MNYRMQSVLLSCCMLIGAGVLIGWNSSRFLTAKPVIREKNLDFLPAPETARVLALGHNNTLAKLRWIDSFAYFQYQLDRKDDRIAGGGSGFQRLYNTLIELDPKFEPFYEHAALTTSGILNHHGAALGFLMRGNLELPHSTELWRNSAVTLKVFFQWDTKNPELFDAFLTEWEKQEVLPEYKRMVWDWKKHFGHQVFNGLEQLPYWLQQLENTAENTANGKFVDQTVRDILARYGTDELTALLATWRILQGAIPQTRKELVDNLSFIDPLQMIRDVPSPASLSVLTEANLLHLRYPQGLSPFAPFAVVKNGTIVLKNDPYGYPWRMVTEKIGDYHVYRVTSPGMERAQIDKLLATATDELLAKAQKSGSWPTSLQEVVEMGVQLPKVPAGCTIRLVDRDLVASWDVEPNEPWQLRRAKP